MGRGPTLTTSGTELTSQGPVSTCSDVLAVGPSIYGPRDLTTQPMTHRRCRGNAHGCADLFLPSDRGQGPGPDALNQPNARRRPTKALEK